MRQLVRTILTFMIFVVLMLFSTQNLKASISFTISNPVVNSDDEIEVDAVISGLITSSCSTGGCYLQAELQSAGGYFGYTLNNSGEYVDYFKTPSTTDEIKSKLFNFMPVSGAWSGKLKVKNNPESQYYYGPGDYLLTFRRFSGNSTSPTSGDSNSLNVSLLANQVTPVPSNTPQVSPTVSPTATSYVLKTASPTQASTQTPNPTSTKTPTLKPKATTTPTASPSGDLVEETLEEKTLVPSPSGQVSGASTEKKDKFPIVAVGLVVVGLVFITFAVFSIIKSVKKSYTGGDEGKDS